MSFETKNRNKVIAEARAIQAEGLLARPDVDEGERGHDFFIGGRGLLCRERSYWYGDLDQPMAGYIRGIARDHEDSARRLGLRSWRTWVCTLPKLALIGVGGMLATTAGKKIYDKATKNPSDPDILAESKQEAERICDGKILFEIQQDTAKAVQNRTFTLSVTPQTLKDTHSACVVAETANQAINSTTLYVPDTSPMTLGVVLGVGAAWFGLKKIFTRHARSLDYKAAAMITQKDAEISEKRTAALSM